MVRRSAPASRRWEAQLWRLCLWVRSRHYLSFLTMSSDIGQRSAEADKIESKRGRTERTTRHSLVDPTGC
jgi:hypothetical protein